MLGTEILVGKLLDMALWLLLVSGSLWKLLLDVAVWLMLGKGALGGSC